MPTASLIVLDNLPDPPRFTGNDAARRAQMEKYLANSYRQLLNLIAKLIEEHNNAVTDIAALEARLGAMAAVADLDLTASATYTQSELQSVADKIDEIRASVVAS